MKRTLSFICLCLCFSPLLPGQVPHLLHYQSRVAVGGVNFNGTGQFRFALVNADGTTSYWSNDGTSTAGSQPTASVALQVTQGLYSVLLGDTSIANMTAIPASVWTNADVRLRVWFNDGTNGSQLLSPDSRLATNGYLPDGAVTSNKIATGAVGSAQLKPGAVAENLAASGQAGIVSGGIVLSATPNAALVNSGYLQIGTALLNNGAPTARQQHSAVWTGTEMIVWGGDPRLNDGARYNPVTTSWPPISPNGAPAARLSGGAVWTGNEMIVWGGNGGESGYLSDGGRYAPQTDSWSAVSDNGAPLPRNNFTVVWTGTEMIVWGGNGVMGSFNDGGRYNPVTNSWIPTPTAGAPTARYNHTAVWTGTEMIVWGGTGSGSALNDGGKYNPTVNVWTPVTGASAPTARRVHSALWTGSEMIVWGGNGESGNVNDGGRYNPTTNSWTAMTTADAPSGRYLNSAVWTGSEMIVWGGFNYTASDVYTNDGGRYNPATNTWTPVTTIKAPAARRVHSSVWTGTEMIVWGGTGVAGSPLNDGGRYNPTTNSWIPVPAARLMYLYQRP